jgi:glycosyltransferase involved in cell wall biosynthesis
MLLVPSANGEALGNAIIQLYHAPDLRQRLQDGARRLARQFEWSSIARETVAFFERVRGAQA